MEKEDTFNQEIDLDKFQKHLERMYRYAEWAKKDGRNFTNMVNLAQYCNNRILIDNDRYSQKLKAEGKES